MHGVLFPGGVHLTDRAGLKDTAAYALNWMMTMNMKSLPPTDPAPTQIVGACPHDCPDTCSLLSTVVAGVATGVRGNPAHAQTDGVLCT